MVFYLQKAVLLTNSTRQRVLAENRGAVSYLRYDILDTNRNVEKAKKCQRSKKPSRILHLVDRIDMVTQGIDTILVPYICSRSGSTRDLQNMFGVRQIALSEKPVKKSY